MQKYFEKEITFYVFIIERSETTDCMQIFLVGVEAVGCNLEEGRVRQEKESKREGVSKGAGNGSTMDKQAVQASTHLHVKTDSCTLEWSAGKRRTVWSDSVFIALKKDGKYH